MGIDYGPTEYAIPRRCTRGMNVAIEALSARMVGRADVPQDVQEEFANMYAVWSAMRDEINEQNRQAQERNARRLEATR